VPILTGPNPPNGEAFRHAKPKTIYMGGPDRPRLPTSLALPGRQGRDRDRGRLEPGGTGPSPSGDRRFTTIRGALPVRSRPRVPYSFSSATLPQAPAPSPRMAVRGTEAPPLNRDSVRTRRCSARRRADRMPVRVDGPSALTRGLRAFGRELGDGVHLVGGELDRRCVEVLLEMLQARCARDRNHGR
jgi:hypothetical protein